MVDNVAEILLSVAEVADALGVNEMYVRRHDEIFKPRRTGMGMDGARYYPMIPFLANVLRCINLFPNAKQEMVAAAIRILTAAKGEEYVKALQREAEHVKGWEDME